MSLSNFEFALFLASGDRSRAQRIMQEPWPGGGASVHTQTATVTTDPDSFEVEHTFDLGHATLAYLTCTVLATDADGETLGLVDEGTLCFDFRSALRSRDGSFTDYPDIAQSFPFLRDDPYAGDGSDLPLLTHEVLGLTPRYLKALYHVCTWSALSTYAGPNSPSAQVRFDVEYL